MFNLISDKLLMSLAFQFMQLGLNLSFGSICPRFKLAHLRKVCTFDELSSL